MTQICIYFKKPKGSDVDGIQAVSLSEEHGDEDEAVRRLVQ